MRLRMRVAGLALGLLTIVAFSGITQAYHTPRWEGTLEVGKMPGTPENMCDPYQECQEFRGIMIQDFDVSDFMDSQSGTANYTLTDLSSYQPITVWRLCKYDAQKTLIECDEDGPFWYLWGTLPSHTDHVRIILKQNAAVEYSLAVAP